MGPSKPSLRGIGGQGGLAALAPPTSPSSGAGGPGVLGGIGKTAPSGLTIQPAIAEVSDVTTGRITLGLINLTVLAMIGFYVWTRGAQGGG